MRVFLFSILVICFNVMHANAASPATTCDELKALTVVEIQTGGATPAAIQECIERGEDPPLKFRKALGRQPISTPVGNTTLLSPCRPSAEKQCPNTLRRYTDGTLSVGGYIPANNPLLDVEKPPIPWGDMDEVTMPCGAVAAFAKNALRELLGEVELTAPISLHEIMNLINMVNRQIGQLQSTLNNMTNIQAQLHDKVNYITGELNGKINMVVSALAAIGSPYQSEINTLHGTINSDVNTLLNTYEPMSPSQIHAELRQIDQKIVTLKQKMGKGREMAANMPNPPISLEDMDNRILLANIDMAKLRSDLEFGLAVAKADEAKAMKELNDFRSGMNEVTNAFPAGLSLAQNNINNGMNFLHTKVTNFINTHTSKTQSQIDSDMAEINDKIDQLQGWLNDAISAISGVQSTIDGLSSDIRDAINDELTTFLGGFFKYKNCQNGQFWGILNYIYNVVMGPGKYIYNNTNNTFVLPGSPIIVTMPVGTTINFNLSNGIPNPITMPLGGTLYNAQGQAMNFAQGTQLKFQRNGIVTTSNGNSFRVNPSQTLKLHPNEAVQIAPGTPITVDPKEKVYPAGPSTVKPPWLDDYIAQSLANK